MGGDQCIWGSTRNKDKLGRVLNTYSIHLNCWRNKNVNGLKKENNIVKTGCDITFLHETHLSKEEHRKLERLATGQVFSSSYCSARRG